MMKLSTSDTYIVHVFQSSLVMYIIFICYQLSRKSNPVMGMEESFNACKTKSNAHATYICIDFLFQKHIYNISIFQLLSYVNFSLYWLWGNLAIYYYKRNTMNKIKILRQFHMHDNVKLISTVTAKWISKSYQEKSKKAIHLKYKEKEEMT